MCDLRQVRSSLSFYFLICKMILIKSTYSVILREGLPEVTYTECSLHITEWTQFFSFLQAQVRGPHPEKPVMGMP